MVSQSEVLPMIIPTSGVAMGGTKLPPASEASPQRVQQGSGPARLLAGHTRFISRRLRANGAAFSTQAAIFPPRGLGRPSEPSNPSVPKISGVSDAPAFTCSARKRGEQRTRSHPRRRGRRRAAHAKGNRHRPTHPRFPRWEWGGANKRVLKSGMKSCTRAKLARSQRGTKWKTPFHKGYQ